MGWSRDDKNNNGRTQPCGACGGQGGHWENKDGKTPGKALSRWVACRMCNGTGQVSA